MEHFTFGRNNGLRVSALALGAGNFGTRWGYGAEFDTARTMFDKFADAGGTFIDTAASYQVGESEENLGKLLAGRRDQFTVATKWGRRCGRRLAVDCSPVSTAPATGAG
jgi:aryl-alcohol dehydrogenase-like predicted oxidoreductase